MNGGDKLLFKSLPKEEHFATELTDYLNKNVKKLVTPVEESAYEFNICIAGAESPLQCTA